MSSVRWTATVDDSPGSEPYSVVGDLVVAVRTPRSRDFVTVEVAPAHSYAPVPAHPADVRLSPRPQPSLTDQWQGEVHLGETVRFRVAGESYRLTLQGLSERASGRPWIRCDFWIERD